MTTETADQQIDAPTARDLRLQLRSGRLSLDFIATKGGWGGREFERIVDSTQWLCWLGKARVTQPPAVTESDLREMAELRDHISLIVHAHVAGHLLPSESIAVVNRFALTQPPPPQLDTHAETLAQLPFQRPDEALSVIARDFIDLLTGPLRDRIRKCGDPTCEFFFADNSRPGNRRWCTSCGAATASANYRKRKNGAGAGHLDV